MSTVEAELWLWNWPQHSWVHYRQSMYRCLPYVGLGRMTKARIVYSVHKKVSITGMESDSLTTSHVRSTQYRILGY